MTMTRRKFLSEAILTSFTVVVGAVVALAGIKRREEADENKKAVKKA